MKKILHNSIFVWAVLTATSATCVSAAVTVPHTFSPGSPAKASEVNDNFTSLADAINQVSGPEMGDSAKNPATNCSTLLQQRPGLANDVYWLKPVTAKAAFRAYCDMTTDGGGWTLVWSNLRGGSGKVVTKLAWGAAINTLPRFKGEPSADIESFEVYTGLKHWTDLATAGELRYAWSHDYGQPVAQHYTVPFVLDPNANYTINFDQNAGIGSELPGLVQGHNGQSFSTYDVDNDASSITHCARSYSDTPFWYSACFSGNINGGGEWGGAVATGGGLTSGGTTYILSPPNGHLNGAYWKGAAPQWGSTDGQGAGNGWIYVR